MKINQFSTWLLFTLVFMLVTNFAICQTSNRTPVIEPSPTSAVFTRYGNDHPSLETGAVNIPISLFDIKAFGINIPLSAHYQTTGINISETPYPMGYGWIFSSGFRITRTIFGRPDDRFDYHQLYGGEDYETLMPGIISESNAYMYGLSNSLWDTQKDIFTLHLPTGSCKFFLNKVGNTYQTVSIGNQNRIEVLSGFTGFKVTDENGIIYMFGYDANTNFQDFTEPSEVGGFSAWTLREIILLNGQKIAFSWQKVNVNAYAPRVNAAIITNDFLDYCADNMDQLVSDYGGIVDYSTFSGANSLMLKKVDYPTGSVEINYKSAQDPFMQNIVIKDKNNNIVKTINFNYGASSTGDQMLLQSLDVNGAKYYFNYNPNRINVGTTALDYWGYYNGKTNNASLIPAMTILYQTPNNGNWQAPSLPVSLGYADRSVSAEHMKACILTRITYPTGGYSDYEYEPHEFQGQYVHSTALFQTNPAPLTFGGGLRVKQISTYASPASTPTVRTYKYGLGESGLGNIPVAPTLDTFIDEQYTIEQKNPGSSCPGQSWPTWRVMTISALSNYAKFLIDKNPIWYSEVSEYINGDQKTTSRFAYNDTYAISWELNYWAVKTPYAFRYDNLFNNGPRLTENIVYKKTPQGYVSQKQTTYDYTSYSDPLKQISNIIIDRKASYINSFAPGPEYDPVYYPYGVTSYFNTYLNANYSTLPYGISVQYDRLSKVTTVDTESNSAITTTEDFGYYGDLPQLAFKTRSSSVTGETITTEFKYPHNFTEPIYLQMTSSNVVSPVIEEISRKGNVQIERVKKNYSSPFSGFYMPGTLEVQKSASDIPRVILRYSYNSRGSLDNILEKDTYSTTYLYSYNSQYPIAEIKNADFGMVKSLLGGDPGIIAFSDLIQPDKVAIDNFLMPLKNNLPSAFISSYVYKPLVGMTSQTDPRGMTTYYEYDGFQRLKTLRDNNGHILKTYCYNYAGQVTDCNAGGGSGPSTPTQVYVRVEVGNSYYNMNGGGGADTETDLYLALYSDAGCTQPISLPQALDVNIGVTETRFENNSSAVYTYTSGYTIPASTNRLHMGRYLTDSYYSYYDPYFGYLINSYNYFYQVEDNGSSTYIPSSTY